MKFAVYYKDRQLSLLKNSLFDAEDWMRKFSCILLNLEIREVKQKSPPVVNGFLQEYNRECVEQSIDEIEEKKDF